MNQPMVVKKLSKNQYNQWRLLHSVIPHVFNGCIFYIENIYGCNGPYILKRLFTSINVYVSLIYCIQSMYFGNFNDYFHQKLNLSWFSFTFEFCFLDWSNSLKLWFIIIIMNKNVNIIQTCWQLANLFLCSYIQYNVHTMEGHSSKCLLKVCFIFVFTELLCLTGQIQKV